MSTARGQPCRSTECQREVVERLRLLFVLFASLSDEQLASAEAISMAAVSSMGSASTKG